MSKKILVIEDNPVVVQLLETLLREHQFEVITAGDGQEGLQRIQSEKPDLIVLDVMMPRMTGYQFFKELRAKGEEFKKIPVLITSAKESMKDFFDRWDIVDFLPKPFNSESLLAKIDAALESSSQAAVLEGASPNIKGKEVLNPAAGATGKKVMLIGVEDFLIEKVKNFLESKQCEIIKGLDAKDAVSTALSKKPDCIFCQYWEDKDRLDAQEISRKLNENAQTKTIPFFVYSSPSNSLEAGRRFRRAQLIEYANADDLIKKIASEVLQ